MYKHTSASQSHLSDVNKCISEFGPDSSSYEKKKQKVSLSVTGLKQKADAVSEWKEVFLRYVTCCQKDHEQQHNLKSLW